MPNQYTVSHDDIEILLKKWPESKLYAHISQLDLQNTEGLAEGSKFKLEFIQNGTYVASVYIKETGEWFSTVENSMIKMAMKSWMSMKSSNRQASDELVVG